MTKWGERPHWEYDATYLGADEHGDWVGIPRGTPMARPGMAFLADVDQVALVPGPDAGAGGWWTAVFHAPGFRMTTYVDMATVGTWDQSADGARVGAVDLDLDVVRETGGRVYVDDEDEFAEHRVSLGYPPEVVAAAEASCAWVLDAVQHGRAPWDGSHLPWLAQVRDLDVPRRD